MTYDRVICQQITRAGGVWREPTKNQLKSHIAPKNMQFECAAQWPFKGTYVRQDISHKTNWIEERNPQSASALYVPLLLSAR
jgi:hypothetical protein